MKGLQVVKAIGGAALAVLGAALALTNPSQDAYEEFAVEQLTTYLKEEVCTQAPKSFENFLQRQCTILVDTGRPQLQEILFEKTIRLNFVFFSIYLTNLEISPFLPAYHFETLGAFQKFYIYKAEEQ